MFKPVLKDMLDANHSTSSARAVARELGWTGIKGEVVSSQLRMLRTVLRMDPGRIPHQIMLRQISAVQRGTGALAAPEQYTYPHHSRLVHLPEVCAPVGTAPINSGGSRVDCSDGSSDDANTSNSNGGVYNSGPGMEEGDSGKPQLLPHKLVIMSLNCKGLRVRNGRSRSKKTHARTLARRKMLAKVVLQQKPHIMALQETWHLPHNDSLEIEGYWYFGRPRVTPEGKSTTSGGVGFLVSNGFGAGNVTERKHIQEAGSTGMIWLDVKLGDGSKISVGNAYSECDNKKSKMGLDMAKVWKARTHGVASIVAEDGGRRPVFLVGDFNVHLGRGFGLGTATRNQLLFAVPCRKMLKDLDMKVMNGVNGTAAPTCYSGVEAACSPTPSLHMGKRSRPPSVIDLAVTRSRHSMTHVSKVEAKRLEQKLTDHRMLVVHARVGAGMGGDGAGLMGEQHGRSVPKQAKLRLLPTMAEAVCERIALEVEKATSQWMETWGDVVSAAGRLGTVGSTNTATTATAATAAAWVAAANMAAADAAVVAAKTVKTATAAVTAIAHAARSQVSRTTETATTTVVVIQASTKRSAVTAQPTQATAVALGLAKDGPRTAAGETVVRATTSMEQSRTEVTATGCSGAAPTAASGNWLLAWSKPNQQILRFERGPTISKLEYFSDRLGKIIGETPDGAIGTLVRYSDDHQALRKYRLVDMVYDIKHGNLVIPELERSPIPPGLKRGVGIVGRHCTSSYRDYIARHYWSIKTGEPKTQKPLGSSFVVSVLSNIKKVYGQEVMESVVDNPVEFAWSTRAVGMERDAVQLVAEHLWDNSSSRVGASNVAHLYEGPSYASISPHLRCIRNSSCAHHMYLISGARTGSIALGYVLDRLYPPRCPENALLSMLQGRSTGHVGASPEWKMSGH